MAKKVTVIHCNGFMNGGGTIPYGNPYSQHTPHNNPPLVSIFSFGLHHPSNHAYGAISNGKAYTFDQGKPVILDAAGNPVWATGVHPFINPDYNLGRTGNMTIGGVDPVVGDVFWIWHAFWPSTLIDNPQFNQHAFPSFTFLKVMAVIVAEPDPKQPHYNYRRCPWPVMGIPSAGFYYGTCDCHFTPHISVIKNPNIDLVAIGVRPPGTKREQMEINNFSMDTTNINEVGERRLLTISGTPGAEAILHITKTDASKNVTYYKIDAEGSYELWGSSSQANKITIDDSGKKSIYIDFQLTTTTNEYYISIVPLDGSTLNLGQSDSHYKSDIIYQYANTTTTFAVSTSSGNYNVSPGSVELDKPRGMYNEDVTLGGSVGLSSGVFFPIKEPSIHDFYSTTTKTMSAAVSDSKEISLVDIEGLQTGMAVSGSGVSGAPVITHIDSDSKVITVSVNQNMSARAITITAYGSNNFNLHKAKAALTSSSFSVDPITTTNSSAVDNSTTIPVASTTGITAQTQKTVDGATKEVNTLILNSITNLFIGQKIMAVSSGTLDGYPTITKIDIANKTLTLSSNQTFIHSATVTFASHIVTGVNVKCSTIDTYVVSVSAPNVVVNQAQTLDNGTTLTFTGVGNTGTITQEMRVVEVGDTNFTTTLNLDNFISELS